MLAERLICPLASVGVWDVRVTSNPSMSRGFFATQASPAPHLPPHVPMCAPACRVPEASLEPADAAGALAVKLESAVEINELTESIDR